MSYDMTGSDGENYHMGCLADVKSEFRDDDLLEYFDVDMGQYLYYSSLLKGSIIEAGALIPEYAGKVMPDEVRINHTDTAAEVHTRLAPYRIFIEMTGSMEFFQMNKQYGAMGAFIACHTTGLDYLGTEIQGKSLFVSVPGWHQSMFCDLSITGLLDSYSIRRVAALYPELRPLFESDYPITSSYVVAQLPDTLLEKVKTALTAAGLRRTGPLDLNSQARQVVERCQLWHDVIYNTLKKEIS